jgi:uncharacterized membrane protein YcaP (DUF421 family)
MSSTLQLWLSVVWHSLAIYLLLTVALRFMGRALMAQFTLLEYFVIALLGSAVETGLYAGSSSLPAGLASAAVLLAANRGLSAAINRSRRLRRFFVGAPLLLVQDGQFVRSHLRTAGLTENDVRAGIRERGYEGLDDVRYAVLEVNGAIGVIPRASQGSGS